jgi:DNA-binding transcriptional MocR family regulator
LPEPLDAHRLLERAVRHGVVYVAGAAFFVNGDGHSLMRLCFSAPSHDRIREGVSRLAAAVREEIAQLTPSAPAAQPAR